MIPFAETKRRWLQDPAFKAEYDALEEEFALIRTLIEARARAGLTQEQVAERMGTKQAAIARLEGGRVRPSIKTLRRYAQATGSRLVLRLEPDRAA
jgi:transcriptional regulator with XRE-family HTH domain